MAVWHLGEGRHTEKLRAAALPRKGAGFQVSWTTLPLLPFSFPLKDMREISAGPGPASGSRVGSLLGRGAGVGDVEAIPPSRRPECNRQHNDGEEEGAKNVESQVKRPRRPYGPCGQGAASKW